MSKKEKKKKKNEGKIKKGREERKRERDRNGRKEVFISRRVYCEGRAVFIESCLHCEAQTNSY